MDLYNILPSPPELYRLALSIFNSTILASHRKTCPPHICHANFDIDSETGFFPRHPLPHLPKPFDLWESALEEAMEKLSLGEDESQEALQKRPNGETWRANIVSWPVIETECLATDLRLLQRAHQVLAWLVHFYVHSIPLQDISPITVPKSLAVPLVCVSKVLGMAPVLTFADTVLWNWEILDPARPVSIDNMRFVYLFSGTEDERNFYTASAKAELRGAEMLRIMDAYHNLPNVTNMTALSKVSRDLTRLAEIIEDISDIIQGVRAACDPHVFYWDIRPWFEGSDAKGPSGPGWVYEGVSEAGRLDLSGPSAGQSSVMHALDIFLGVDHGLQQKRFPAPSTENKRADHGFMMRMKRYMPGKHREYLAQLAAAPRPVRELAANTPALREPFDAAVMALKKLRDHHLRIACLYIVTMSRSLPGARGGCPVSAMLSRLETSRVSGKGPVRGTGGTELSLLLKAGRDATRRTALKDN